MPLDSLTIHALIKELEPELVGAKIDKVQQPARDMLLLSIRGAAGNFRLVVSGGVVSARLNMTEESFDNPQSPPMFCMLMRKHIAGARITALYQPDFERMAVMELAAYDEMGFPEKKKLVIEMMGRGTNIILVGGDGHIIDCLRRVDAEMNPARQVLPGLIYRLPPKQDKLPFFTSDSGKKREFLQSTDGAVMADRWLTNTFSGISPALAREMCARAFGSVSVRVGELSPEQRLNFADIMDAFCESANAGEFVPCMVLLDGRPKEFSCVRLSQYEGVGEIVIYPGFSSLIDAFYTKKDKAENIRHRSQSLHRSVKNAYDRTLRKLELQRSDLKKTDARDELRKCGDLITANIYRLKKGMTEFETQDYYLEDCPIVKIKLDPQKTPQQNAAAYYKQYGKARSAAEHLVGLIETAERDAEYLQSVLDELERAENDGDLAEIRAELTQTGYLRQQKGKTRQSRQEHKPLVFRSTSGLDILVGRSNVQNDRLTSKLARRNDVWLHTQKIHGSHVILRTEDEQPDMQSIMEAAAIAAYYSQGRDSGKVPVDYTLVRYVKKPSGALPGKVIYTDYSTVMVQPDEELVGRLRVK